MIGYRADNDPSIVCTETTMESDSDSTNRPFSVHTSGAESNLQPPASWAGVRTRLTYRCSCLPLSYRSSDRRPPRFLALVAVYTVENRSAALAW
jgi:hypothetical protein